MKEKKGYFIKDSFGCFGGNLRLQVKNLDGSGTEWCYVANRNADYWHTDKNLALARIKQLEELNQIAQIPDLKWELVYADFKEFPVVKKEGSLNNPIIIFKDIPFGYVGKTRKAAQGIMKKYKTIFSEIEKAFRKRLEVAI